MKGNDAIFISLHPYTKGLITLYKSIIIKKAEGAKKYMRNQFLKQNKLAPLSEKEALKRIK